jgi:hypothetical protein
MFYVAVQKQVIGTNARAAQPRAGPRFNTFCSATATAAPLTNPLPVFYVVVSGNRTAECRFMSRASLQQLREEVLETNLELIRRGLVLFTFVTPAASIASGVW